MHSAVPAGLFDRERDMLARAAPPVGAGGLDQQVADQGAQRAVRVGADDGADRVVARAGEQWHVATVVVLAAVRTAGRPVVQDVAVAQVPDAAGAGQQIRERPGLRHLAERPAGQPGDARQRGAEVRCSEVEDMPDVPHPWCAVLAAVVAGGTDDQAAHGVAHQQDLPYLAWPRSRQPVEQPGQLAAVVGHVPAGVVADVDRRIAELCLQPAAVRRGPARLPEPGVLRLDQAVNEDGQLGRGLTERVPHLLGRQLDIVAGCAHRHADGQWSQLGPSRSPVTAFSAASAAPLADGRPGGVEQ